MTGAGPPAQRRDLAYIDALRGYAVLLVIIVHSGAAIAELPYPLKRLTNLGWHGVQLFFLVSCVTLMMSWRGDEARGRANAAKFWVRRYLRIAPAYYLAGLVYFFVRPAPHGFQPGIALASALFVNSWHPLTTPTVDGAWSVVPGGWSIGVEFSFYLLFPLIARTVRTMGQAVMFCAGAITLAVVTNRVVAADLIDLYGKRAASEFLYFWLISQLPVFALGTVLYIAIMELTPAASGRWLGRHALVLTAALALAAVAVAEGHFTEYLGQSLRNPPQIALITVLLACFSLVVSQSGPGVLVNAPIRALGKVSFSAYLWHFGALDFLRHVAPSLFAATGWAAIGAFGVVLLCAVPLVFAVSWLTYKCVELPMINVARRLTR